jgi:hypothetical protein
MAGNLLRRSWVLVAVGCLWLAARAEAGPPSVVLRGTVSLHHEHGSPVGKVAIWALGANPVISGDDGRFVLEFGQSFAGQSVNILVARTGWGVVNHLLLEPDLPSDGTEGFLEVILGEVSELEQLRIEFYRTRINRAFERLYGANFARQAGTLEATSQEFAERLSRDVPSKNALGAQGRGLRQFLEGDLDGVWQALGGEQLIELRQPKPPGVPHSMLQALGVPALATVLGMGALVVHGVVIARWRRRGRGFLREHSAAMRRLGGCYIFLGLASCILCFWLSNWSPIFFGGFGGFMTLAVSLFRIAQRADLVSGDQKLSYDDRPPVLLLRSFEMDAPTDDSAEKQASFDSLKSLPER